MRGRGEPPRRRLLGTYDDGSQVLVEEFEVEGFVYMTATKRASATEPWCEPCPIEDYTE